jgi:GNAT superfamily N-acetyltransferase
MVTFAHFQPHMLPSLVDCWNSAFSAMRNFGPVSTAELRARVVQQRVFDPKGLIVALAGSDGPGSPRASSQGEVIGLVHALRPLRNVGNVAQTDIACQTAERIELVYSTQRCWDHTCIAVLAVAPDWRERGSGTSLLAQAEAYLSGHRDSAACVLVGDYDVPLYHTLEGPRQPLWGDTEIMGVAESDSGLIDFFARRGYRRMPQEGQEITMLAALGRRSRPPQPPLEPVGLRVVRLSDSSPWNGLIAWYPSGAPTGYVHRFFGAYRHQVLALARDDTITSQAEWYPMRQPGRVALFDFQVAQDDRGKSLGTYLLDEFLWQVSDAGYKEVELHTHTVKNALAYEMYQRRGFRTVESWVRLSKDADTD